MSLASLTATGADGARPDRSLPCSRPVSTFELTAVDKGSSEVADLKMANSLSSWGSDSSSSDARNNNANFCGSASSADQSSAGGAVPGDTLPSCSGGGG